MLCLYPLKESTIETLTQAQLIHFEKARKALIERIRLEGIDEELLDLEFNGIDQPLPFPDLHWELVACWMVIDGTTPSPITLANGEVIDYSSILLRDQPTLTRWKHKLSYAKTGFRYK